MSKRRRAGGETGFFERFRVGLSRYAEGVHELAPGASAATIAAAEARLERPLPALLRAWLGSFDGARLFHESYVLVDAAELSAASRERLRLGEGPEGELLIDEAGRVIAVDEDGDAILVGSDLDAFLAAVMAREALLIDAEGEFREAFVPGGALAVAVRKRRARAGSAADPGAAAWQLEAAELAFEEGEELEAERALERVVELDAQAAQAWELLGGIRRRAGREAEAARAHASAAAAATDPALAAVRYAEAAAAGRAAGLDPSPWGEAALQADPEAPGRWLEAARARVAAAELDEASRLLELVEAIAPGPEAAALRRELRTRGALKLV